MALPDFSIEWLERDEISICALCSGEVGSGPVGWHKGNPIGAVCDRCLADYEPRLGAMLLAINVVRQLAAAPAAGKEDAGRAARALTAFAHAYHRAQDWPARSADIVDLLERPGWGLAGAFEPDGVH